MLTAADFLHFGVSFAQQDLAALRPGDWLNLREDFETFLGRRGCVPILGSGGGSLVAYPTEAPFPEDFDLSAFQALQRQTLPLLQQLASQQGSAGTFPDVAMTLYPHGREQSTPGRNQLMIHGGTDQCFLTILLWLLSQERADRLLPCPECGTLFYRVKQQAYCSRTCANRVTVRNWRARREAATTV